MNWVKEMRLAIGLSQEHMANYLGLSRSQLGSVEINRRELNHLANMRMSDLAIYLDKAGKTAAATRPKEAEQLDKAQKMLARHAGELEYRLMKAQRQLEAVQAAYQQQVQLHHFITHLKTADTLHAKTKPHATWLDLMELEALQAIEKHGLQEQVMLEVEIGGLEKELEVVKGRLENSIAQGYPSAGTDVE